MGDLEGTDAADSARVEFGLPAPEPPFDSRRDVERLIEEGDVVGAREQLVAMLEIDDRDGWAALELGRVELRIPEPGSVERALRRLRQASDLGMVAAGQLLANLSVPVLPNRQQLVDDASRSLFRVRTTTRTGQAQEGLGVLTAGGVVLASAQVVIGIGDRNDVSLESLQGGDPLGGEVLWFTSSSIRVAGAPIEVESLAAIRIDGFLDTSHHVPAIGEPSPGELVFALSRNGVDEACPEEAVVEGRLRRVVGEPARWLEHGLVLRDEDAGTPLFNARGWVVGITTRPATGGPAIAVVPARFLRSLDDLRGESGGGTHRCCVACGRRSVSVAGDSRCSTCGWRTAGSAVRSGFTPVAPVRSRPNSPMAGTGADGDTASMVAFPPHVSTWLASRPFGSNYDWSMNGVGSAAVGVAELLDRWIFRVAAGGLAAAIDHVRIERSDPFRFAVTVSEDDTALPVALLAAATSGAAAFYLRSVRPGLEQAEAWRDRAFPQDHPGSPSWPGRANWSDDPGKGLTWVAEIATTAYSAWSMCGPDPEEGFWFRVLDTNLLRISTELGQGLPYGAGQPRSEDRVIGLRASLEACLQHRRSVDSARSPEDVAVEERAGHLAAIAGYLTAMERSLEPVIEAARLPGGPDWLLDQARADVRNRWQQALALAADLAYQLAPAAIEQ